MNEQLSHKDFTELELWKQGRVFKNEIAKLVKSFPVDEKYKLVDQLTRSSRSINANVAEGHGRYTYKEQVRFCIQARGSLAESYNHLIDAFDCGYIDEATLNQFKESYKKLERLLNGYITWLRKSINTD